MEQSEQKLVERERNGEWTFRKTFERERSVEREVAKWEERVSDK